MNRRNAMPVDRSVRIGVIATPPASTDCAVDPNCPRRGFAIDLLLETCELLRLNCTLEWFDGEYGDADNETGLGSGLIGAIQRGQFDLSIPIVTPTYNRAKAVDFSHIYFYSDLIFITRVPTASLKLNWNIFYAYQWPVVLAFFVALMVIGVLFTTIHTKKYRHRTPPNRPTADLLVGHVAALITKRFDLHILTSTPIRIVIGIWGLAAIVLVRAYTGILFSDAVLTTSEAPFVDLDSFATCLADGRCRLIMPSTLVYYYFILTSNERIQEALRYNPAMIVEQDRIPETILDERESYLVWFWYKEGVMFEIRNTEGCRFYTVDTAYRDECAFAMRKDSWLQTEVDRLGVEFRESGIADAVLSEYRFGSQICNEDGRRVANAHGQLYESRTMFYFYCFGTVAGVVWFLVEMIGRECSAIWNRGGRFGSHGD